MANFLLKHMETIMLKKQTPNHLKMYVRYLNHIFAVFDNDNACMSFLEVLNNQHKNISYTFEKSIDTLQFLCVVVQINNQGADTWVLRKPTNTVCPLNRKSGLFSYMLHRAKINCSTDNLFLKEINQLRSLFLVDNYS